MVRLPLGTTFYLVRHCAATGQGADAPLTEAGAEQARGLAERLASFGIQRLVSSPYRRAVDSVRPFAEASGLLVETDERLVERVLADADLPDWRERLADTFADADLRLPGGESSREAAERGLAAVREAVLPPGEGPVALVSHGCLITLILREVDSRIGFADWEQMGNPDLFRVVVSEVGVTVERT